MPITFEHGHRDETSEFSALRHATTDELRALDHHYNDVLARADARRLAGEPEEFDPKDSRPRTAELSALASGPGGSGSLADLLGAPPAHRPAPPVPSPHPDPAPATEAPTSPAPETAAFPGVTEADVRGR